VHRLLLLLLLALLALLLLLLLLCAARLQLLCQSATLHVGACWLAANRVPPCALARLLVGCQRLL
jgi:hypothetical protein